MNNATLTLQDTPLIKTQVNVISLILGMDFCDRPSITLYYSYFSAN